jgi:hypothetical protein
MKKVHLLLLFFLAFLCGLYLYNNTEPFRLSSLEEKDNAGLNTCRGGLYCLDGELCDNYPDLYKRHFTGEKYYLRKNIITSENDPPAKYKIIAKQCVGADNRLKECDQGETPIFIFHKNDNVMKDQYDAEYIKSPGNCSPDIDYPDILQSYPNSKIKLKPNNVCIEKQLIPKEGDNGVTHYFGTLCSTRVETQDPNNMYLTPSNSPNEFCGKYTMNNYDPTGGGESLYDVIQPVTGDGITAYQFVNAIGDYQKSIPNMCDLSSTDDYKRQTSNYTLRAVADPLRNGSVFKNNKYFTSLCNLREDLFISVDNIRSELTEPGPWSKCIILNRQYVEDTPENFAVAGYFDAELNCDSDEIIIISVHPNSIVTDGQIFRMKISSNANNYSKDTYFVYNNSGDNFTTILPFVNETLEIDDSDIQEDPDDPDRLNGLTLEQHIGILASYHNGHGGFSGEISFVLPDDSDSDKIFGDFNVVVNIKKIKISSLTDTGTNIGDNSFKIEYFISLINMVTDTYTKFIKNIIGKENSKIILASAGHPGSDDIDDEIESVILDLFTITKGTSDDTTLTVHPENLNSLIEILVPNLSQNPELQWYIRDYRTTNGNSALTPGAKNARKIEIIKEIIKIIIDHILKNSCHVINRLSNIKSRFENLLTSGDEQGDLSANIETIDTKLMGYLSRLLNNQQRLIQFNRTLEEMIKSSVDEPNTVNAVDYIYNTVNSPQPPSLSNTPSLVCSSNVWLQELKEKLDDIGNSITSPGDSGDLETAKTDAKKSYIRDIINRGRHFTGEYSDDCDFSRDGIISDSRQPKLQDCILNNIKKDMRSECYGKLLPHTGNNCHSNSTWQRCRTSIEGLPDDVKSSLGYCDLTGANNLWVDESSQCNNRNYGPWNYLTAG